MTKLAPFHFLLITIFIYLTPAANASLLCKQVLEGKATIEVNQKMVEKYPDLEFILKDPVAFKAEMQNRFKRQKEIDPENPHRFDFSEVGLAELKVVQKMIPEEIAELKERLSIIEMRLANKSISNKIKGIFLRDQRKKAELESGIRYLKSLLKEANFLLRNVKID
jgi:hypothetical protein